jgi:hypothetical protein
MKNRESRMETKLIKSLSEECGKNMKMASLLLKMSLTVSNRVKYLAF